MPLAGGAKPVRLTRPTAYDHGIAWAPDNSKILFLSDRDGHENIYLLEADDPEHPKFVEAHRFKTTQLTHIHEAASASPSRRTASASLSPRRQAVDDEPRRQRPERVVDDAQVIDYEWSPDAKWIVYARMDGSFASELYIIPATGATAENRPATSRATPPTTPA